MKRFWDGCPQRAAARCRPGAGDDSKRGAASDSKEVARPDRLSCIAAHAPWRMCDPHNMVLVEHLPADISPKELRGMRAPDQFGPFSDVIVKPADDGSCSAVLTYHTAEAMYCATEELDGRRFGGDGVTILRARSWRSSWRIPPREGYRGRILRTRSPDTRVGEWASEDPMEREGKARVAGAHPLAHARIATEEPPDWMMLQRSQGHQAYATVLRGKDSSQAERPILCVFCNAIKSPRCREPHRFPLLGEATALMRRLGINKHALLYYDPSSPKRPAGWNPDPLYARLVERVKGAFWFELGEKESFDMLFMQHSALVSTGPSTYAVGIGSDWDVRVGAASLAFAAANSDDYRPRIALVAGFSAGLRRLLSATDACV